MRGGNSQTKTAIFNDFFQLFVFALFAEGLIEVTKITRFEAVRLISLERAFFSKLFAGCLALTLLSLVLEIHQPVRINRSFPLERLSRIANGLSVTDHYFDRKLNEEVFKKVARKCYYPTFSILRELLESSERSEPPFKVTFGVSGPFVEQAMRYEPELIETMKRLVASGRVEILGNTYYHSLASLFPGDKSEFKEQVREHSSLVRSVLNYETKVFENTEFIYNNTIAQIVESLGFEGILSEGAESVLGWRSPTFLYSAEGTKALKLML